MQRYPFHLVDYSPWPILVSGSVFLLPLSLLYAMRRGNTNVMIFALAQISLIAGLRMAIILFITREVIFFFRFFWAFFCFFVSSRDRDWSPMTSNWHCNSP